MTETFLFFYHNALLLTFTPSRVTQCRPTAKIDRCLFEGNRRRNWKLYEHTLMTTQTTHSNNSDSTQQDNRKRTHTHTHP